MSQTQRREPRHRVHLTVRFERAREFVIEYAENLSNGGLFVRGLEDVEPGQVMRVTLDLPGAGELLLETQVAHVLTREQAAPHGRQPGAGLQIIGAQAGCREVLRSYLLRLGSRREHLVLVDHPELRPQLEHAGYQVAALPPPGELLQAVSQSEALVIAVVVAREQASDYEAAAQSMGAPELVKVADDIASFDELLTSLDAELPDVS